MCFGMRKRERGGEGSRSRDIDRTIHQDEKRMSKEVKLLLLGAGESGKLTIKQMKLIYQQGFKEHERLDGKPIIFSNIV